MSRRTLYRHVKAEGSSLRKLTNEVRCELRSSHRWPSALLQDEHRSRIAEKSDALIQIWSKLPLGSAWSTEERSMIKNEIEAVARAFYDLQDCARGWDREPARLKEQFLSDARASIAALDEHRVVQSFRSNRLRHSDCDVGDNPPVEAPRIAASGHDRGCREVAHTGNEHAFEVCSKASSSAAKLSALSWEQIHDSKARIAQSFALLQRYPTP